MNYQLQECHDLVDDYFAENEYVHIDELEKYDDAAILLKKILKYVYVTGDIKDFEDSLDELCDVFGIKIPYSKPIIRGA